MKKAVLTLTLLASTAAFAQVDNAVKTVLKDRYFQTGECSKYLSTFPDGEKESLIGVTSALEIEDQLSYVTGGDTLIGGIEPAFKAQGIIFNDELQKARDSEYGKRDILYAYSDELYSSETIKKANVEFNSALKGMTKEQRLSIIHYLDCRAATTATGMGMYANHFKKYIDFVKARPVSATVGHFQVSAKKSYATIKVGTGNQYAEPKQWEGSRFFIVNASFKNLDTESRLPVGGSLFINYNGKDYEFDAVEPIVLQGYNIWFRSINPLITMKTKIVYRIPNEVSGEVFWRPGRNPTDTRLWLGTVNAVD